MKVAEPGCSSPFGVDVQEPPKREAPKFIGPNEFLSQPQGFDGRGQTLFNELGTLGGDAAKV
jgi:hypothetical protein